MIRTLGRFADREIALDPGEVTKLRAFFANWVRELD
jgi:hypothetical protein